MEIHDGKTILTFLENGKDYKIYSADNRVVGTMKGKELYEGHYDQVSAKVRKRYAQMEQKAVQGKQVAAPKAPPVPKRR